MPYESTVQRNNSARSVHAKLCGQMCVTYMYYQNMAAVKNDTGKSIQDGRLIGYCFVIICAWSILVFTFKARDLRVQPPTISTWQSPTDEDPAAYNDVTLIRCHVENYEF